ncbi:hypothetical protein H5410_046952 [Solanum commersonii]|uniref:Uncharacterized protein n=1 Tax=Solanum commersonii TaxID=4109 RepID=A0A9J5XH88_SOLCO|nr:hypothetical protein H5410_046952 [Solanum commersonii]
MLCHPHAHLRRHLGGLFLSILTSNDSHCQGINRNHVLSNPGREDGEAPGACEEEEKGTGIPEGSEAGVGEGASAGNESTLTSGEVSAGAALLLSTSSRVNSSSICQMFVDNTRMTSISLIGSQGTLTRWHNSVIKIGNGREVSLCLALMTISCELSSPRSIRLMAMIESMQAALGWHIIDSFWDGMIVILMKPNQNWEVMFMSLFSMGAPASIHLGVVLEIIGPNQSFKSSRD